MQGNPVSKESANVGDRASWDLEKLAGSTGLIDWMSNQFKPFRGLRVAEIGAGIGTFTSRLLEGGALEVLALEPDPDCLEILRERFEADERVRIASQQVPGAPELAQADFDLVICQNVLEHIADDQSALDELAGAVAPGGRIFILVPALPALFGSLDQSYGHHRRYTPEDLRSLSSELDLEEVSIRYFNALGIVGWWAKCRTGAVEISDRSLGAYELLLKVWRPIEERVSIPFGLSLILEAARPEKGLQG